jgi:hypothetical protein
LDLHFRRQRIKCRRHCDSVSVAGHAPKWNLANICLLLALGLPLLGGLLIALAGRRLGPRVGWLALAFPLVSTGALLVLAANLDQLCPK